MLWPHFTLGLAVTKMSFSTVFLPKAWSFVWLTTTMKSSLHPPKVITDWNGYVTSRFYIKYKAYKHIKFISHWNNRGDVAIKQDYSDYYYSLLDLYILTTSRWGWWADGVKLKRDDEKRKQITELSRWKVTRKPVSGHLGQRFWKALQLKVFPDQRARFFVLCRVKNKFLSLNTPDISRK